MALRIGVSKNLVSYWLLDRGHAPFTCLLALRWINIEPFERAVAHGVVALLWLGNMDLHWHLHILILLLRCHILLLSWDVLDKLPVFQVALRGVTEFLLNELFVLGISQRHWRMAAAASTVLGRFCQL